MQNTAAITKDLDFDELTSYRNHYELLGISASADDDALRKAFHKLSKELHPDTTMLPQGEAAQRFHEVCEAYELLADPILREAYDLDLAEKALQKKIMKSKSDFFSKNYLLTKHSVGDRRPLSGGELFSLLLLSIALLVSLSLAIGFGIVQGRDLIVRPTWLTDVNDEVKVLPIIGTYDFTSFNKNSFKPTLFKSS